MQLGVPAIRELPCDAEPEYFTETVVQECSMLKSSKKGCLFSFCRSGWAEENPEVLEVHSGWSETAEA
jgi:hypothetical protein